MKKVVAITLGPIGDIMSIAKSPAMLWYSSAVFSRLAFTICKNIKKDISGAEIIVPYINDEALKAVPSPDGIGKYHDRIIFKADDVGKIGDIIENSKKEIADMIAADMKMNDEDIGGCESFMLNFLQAPYVIVNENNVEGNVILGTSRYLDALEQMKCFNPENTDNPIIRLFGGKKNNASNYVIKACKMQSEIKNDCANLLKTVDGKNCFRDIEDIAGKGRYKNTDKALQYYAIIQADGDKMGEYLLGISGDDSVNDFSSNCITYAGKIAENVKNYGGMTIYAGGDDLLAIVPVLSFGSADDKNLRTVFDLCKDINKIFKENVAANKDVPSVSIGVAIRYIKFPLYEALSASATALFGVAKCTKGKSCIAVDFQKHSGQSIKLTVPAEKLDFISGIMKADADIQSVNSIIYILETFKAMFYNDAETQEDLTQTITNIFKNLYDNASQEKYLPYILMLAKSLSEMMNDEERKISVYACDDNKKTDLKAFEGILRIKKFITEEVYNDEQVSDKNKTS